MNKILTQTELDAKKYELLSALTSDHDLHFIVIDERDKEPSSNRIIVRASYFEGVEPWTHKILDGYKEFAVIKYVDATEDDLTKKGWNMLENIKAECEQVA